MKISSADFIKSASKMSEAPEDEYPEIIVIWRSNVGKSSLINMLTNINQLAKSSSKPGKTKLINYFLINKNRYLVDLPGYGYAKIGLKTRRAWMDIMYDYFTTKATLKKVFVLIDGKIPPQRLDIEFLVELEKEAIPFDIIITKIDKAKQKELSKNLKNLKKELSANLEGELPRMFLTSVLKKRGKKEILDYIETLI